MDPKTPDDEQWWRYGLCNDGSGQMNRLFFPEESRSTILVQIETKWAKAVCNICPVQTECLKWALETQEPDGIWGGKTADERKRILSGKVVKLRRHGSPKKKRKLRRKEA